MQNSKAAKRKRVNFMIDTYLLEDLETLIASGERSNFVNEALEDKLIQLSRQKAVERSDELRKRFSIKMSEEEIKREIRYGLE